MPPLADGAFLDRLRRQLAPASVGLSAREVWSTGVAPLDELLPENGVRGGSIVEWLSADGSSAATLSWLVARRLQQRPIIVIDLEREFFPPGAAQLGVDLQRVVVLQPAHRTEMLWAVEQSLRSPAGNIVLGRFDRLSSQTCRRFQLAAERGGGLGLFLRPLRSRGDCCWADVRLLVQSQLWGREDPAATGSFTRLLRLELLHVRGGGFQQRTTVMSIDDDACAVSVDSQLACATTPGTAARAS